MARRLPTPSLYVDPGALDRVTISTSDGQAVAVPRSFSAVYDVRPAGVVRLELRADHGRVRVAELQVTEAEDGDGLTGLTIDGIPLGRLLERAVTQMTFLSSTVGLPASREAAAQASRRRRRMTDDRLREVANAYARGGTRAVMDAESVSERQAYRLLRRARDAGMTSDQEGGDR